MPFYDLLPIKVTLTVEVDGHVLTFEETGKAKGARYNGDDPRAHDYATSDTLESSLRDEFDACTSRVAKRAEDFLVRAYPVAGSPRPSTST